MPSVQEQIEQLKPLLTNKLVIAGAAVAIVFLLVLLVPSGDEPTSAAPTEPAPAPAVPVEPSLPVTETPPWVEPEGDAAISEIAAEPAVQDISEPAPTVAEPVVVSPLTPEPAVSVPAVTDPRPAPIAASPTTVADYISRGNQRLASGQTQQAMEDFEMAIDMDKRSAEAFLGQGDAQMAAGEYKAATKSYGRAIKLRKGWATAYAKRGEAWQQLGNAKKAQKDMDKAAELDPNQL